MMRKALSYLAKSLITAIFIGGGIGKLRQRKANLEYMGSKGLPKNPGLLGLAALAEVGLGPAVLLGFKPKISAPLLAAYLLPVSFIFHDFWNQEGQQRQEQQIHFLKNLAIIGGLIEVALLENELAKAEGEKPSEEVSRLPEQLFRRAA